MGKYTLTVSSCTIMDTERGEYRTFFAGDEFDDNEDAHLLELMGEHLFEEQAAPEAEPADLHKMKVHDLVAIAADMDLEPRSMKKQDLIDAIEAAQSKKEEG